MYPSFNSIKWFYDINCYTNEDIQTYVELGVTTKEEYKKITGEDYPEQPQA
ncbi:XkdX family protein [Staphylococcus cohnii]|uniref:XkdX family protein n=1 Tax=Staphylococcus cohnii TaxID=29382 RepID=UPI0002FDA30A|nr:XkdX family protein [Staphylococcus cohnii]